MSGPLLATPQRPPPSVLRTLLNSEAAAGIALMLAALVALAVANSPLAPTYFAGLHAYLGSLSAFTGSTME